MAITVSTNEPKKKEVKEALSTFNVEVADGLNELYDMSKSIQSDCTDTIIPEANLETLAVYANEPDLFKRGSEPTRFKAHFITGDEDEKMRVGHFTDYAMGQLCNKLSIPAAYLYKCYDMRLTDLAENNINTWIDHYDRDLMLRQYFDSASHRNLIRGVLSSKYSVFDTPDILDVVYDSTRGLDLKVKSYFMNYERFHARMIQQEPMNIDGEDLFAGISIDSSDVGRSTLYVTFFIYKQVCTNGLCISKGNAELFKQKHISIAPDEFRKELTASLNYLPELIDEYENVIRRVKVQNSITPIKNLKTATDKELENLIDLIKGRTKLADDGAKRVVEIADLNYGFSDWGVINAITEVAQDYTLERRIELERIAGAMLSRVS